MASIVCIDPIRDNLGCSVAISREGSELFHNITYDPRMGNLSWNFLEQGTNICFDVTRIFDAFGNFNSLFVHDVKMLYELRGKKFDTLVELVDLVLGSSFSEKYTNLATKVKAHSTSYRIAKIDTTAWNDCALIPHDLFYDFYKERAKLILELYRRHCEDRCAEVDEFYKSLYQSALILENVASQQIDIVLKALDGKTGHHVGVIKKNTFDGKAHLHFHLVGAKTGRLAFKKGTINIYGLPKDLRSCIVAPQDCSIVEFDLKSAQPRLAIMSTMDEDFKIKFRDIRDIYSVFPGDRQKNKIDFLTWMYSNNKNEMFEKEAYPICTLRDELYIQARNTGKVANRFGRVLYWQGEEKNVVFQNYVTSNEVDAILLVMKHMHERLKGTKSRILYPFHDSIVCAVHKDEENIINELKDIMEKTLYVQFNSYFPVEIKMGKNYGEMNE